MYPLPSAIRLVRLQAPEGAHDMALYTAAAKAARVRDLKAHVVTAEGKQIEPWPCGTTFTRFGPGAPKGLHPLQ